MKLPIPGRTILAFAFTLIAANACAQTVTGNTPLGTAGHPVEVTAFVSHGSPVSSTIGAAINFAWTSNASIEAEVGYQPGDIDGLSSSVSLIYTLPRIGRVAPYLAAGGGIGTYSTAFSGPDNSIVVQSGAAFAINAGGGVKVPVDDTWAFRSDARWYQSFGRMRQEHWRLFNGITYGTGTR